jgi:hypothetical protein
VERGDLTSLMSVDQPNPPVPGYGREGQLIANTVEKLRYEAASKFPLNFFEGKVRNQKPPTRP